MTEAANELAHAKSARRPQKRTWFWLAPSIAVAAIAVVVCLWPQPRQTDLENGVTWLTPAEAAKVFGPPGSVTRLKFRVLRWSPLIWKWYTRAKTQIQITITLLSVATDSNLDKSGIVVSGGRGFTNSGGMRSWVVPADQWPQAQRDLHRWTQSSMRMTTMEGVDVAMFSGAPGGGGTSISISPRVKQGGFDLILNAVYSSPPNANTNATSAMPPVQSVTNLAVVCRAIIPNSGAFIVDGGKNPDEPGNENYWLIISPVAVDAKGRPKKI